MNPEGSLNPQQKLEMRVTALLLGELPAEEAALLRAQIDGDPALADLRDRLQHAIVLLRETRKIQPDPTEAAPASLSAERRERLFAHFKTVPTPVAPARRNWSWVASLGIAATFVVLVGGALMNVETYKAHREPPDFTARSAGLISDDVSAGGAVSPNMAGTHFSGGVAFETPPSPLEIDAISSSPIGALAAPQSAATPAPAMSAKSISRTEASRSGGFKDGWANGRTTAAPLPDTDAAATRAAQEWADQSRTMGTSPLSASTGNSFSITTPGTGQLTIQNGSGTTASTFSGTISGKDAVDHDFFSKKAAELPAISLDSGISVNAPQHPATTSLGFGILPDSSGSLTKSGAGRLVLGGANTLQPTPPLGQTIGPRFASRVEEVKRLADRRNSNLGDTSSTTPGDIAVSGRVFSNEGGIAAAKDVAPFNGGTLSIGDPVAAPAPVPVTSDLEKAAGREIPPPPQVVIRGQRSDTPSTSTATPAESEITADTRSTKTEANKAKNTYAEQAYNETRSRMLWQAQTVWQSPVRKPKEDAPNRVAAPLLTPQPEIATSENAFSTFSLNVTDVAFKLAAASLDSGQMPDPGSMRSEEFINAFDYRDPEPGAGAPLTFASERARYPFAQNRDLLRLSVKTASAGRAPGRALNLVLLLDNSGSMERADRVRIVQEALRVLAAQLQPADKVSVITFARTPRLWIDGVSGSAATAAFARVAEIAPQGGTNLQASLDLGYQTAHRHFQAGHINRVVLLTDGAANLGDVDPEALKQKVEAERKQGIALDAFGVGWEGLDDTMLETLSRNGDGRYGFINTPEAAATEFAGQLAGALRVAASDVKVQVEFNPRRVGAYRQIGYAKHQLTKEQFHDNTVDAAEIGAAESGNALYAIEVNPLGEGDIATVRVRFKLPGTSDYREHSWSVPFTPNAPPLDQASPSLRLAGTAAAFSEMLAGSQFAAEVTSDVLLRLINGVPVVYASDPRPAKLASMIQQARSLSGR